MNAFWRCVESDGSVLRPAAEPTRLLALQYRDHKLQWHSVCRVELPGLCEGNE